MIRNAYISAFGILSLLAGCSSDAGFSGAAARPEEAGSKRREAGAPETVAARSPEESTAEIATEPSIASDPGIGTDTQTTGVDAAIKVEGGITTKDGEAVRVEREFEVAKLIEGELDFDFTRGVFEQGVTLESNYEAVSKDLYQVDRPSYSKLYYQGTSGMTLTDSDMQNAMGVLDLVVVIDNSGSMAQEQTNLSTKLAPLLEYVSDSDWTINVVTTDPDKGCSSGGLIKKGAANASSAFQTAVSAGTGGSSNERGILQAVNALRCDQVMGFPRANSSIAVLIVADEDNCSANGANCGTAAWNTPAYLTNFLQNDLGRTLGNDARIYGIFWHPDTAAAQCSTGQNKATQYAQAVATTGGVYGSICSSDYAPTLRRISQDMATILKNQFTLSATPDAGSVVVKVNGVVQAANTWTLSGRIVTFTQVPPVSATIAVSYTVGASPIKTRFALDETPALDTLVVLIDGAMADKNGYSVDANTKELVFAAPPPDNAEIAIAFRGNLALATDFALGDTVRGGSLSVAVNGVSASGYSLTAGGVLQFATPPRDGATVSVTYEAFRSKQLEYPVALAGQAIKNLTIVDADSGDPVEASVANATLSVAEAAHEEGRRLLVRYENETSEFKTLTLSQVPEADSVSLEGAPEACLAGLTIEGKSVTFRCAYSSDRTLTIHFRYRETPVSSFVMAAVDEPETGLWQVFVDGLQTSAYERRGNVIALTEQPAAAAIVRIVWTSEL